MPDNKIIAIVGMCGSGKSILAEKLTARGFGYVRLGQLTIDVLKERGMEINETNERAAREELRRDHGMAAFAKLNIPKFDAILKKQNLVADGLYSWAEYKLLKKNYGERLSVVAIFVPPELRYARLAKRALKSDDKAAKYRPLTPEEAKTRDFSEIENLDKGGPIAMADYTILNLGSQEEFAAGVEKFINGYLNENKN